MKVFDMNLCLHVMLLSWFILTHLWQVLWYNFKWTFSFDKMFGPHCCKDCMCYIMGNLILLKF